MVFCLHVSQVRSVTEGHKVKTENNECQTGRHWRRSVIRLGLHSDADNGCRSSDGLEKLVIFRQNSIWLSRSLKDRRPRIHGVCQRRYTRLRPFAVQLIDWLIDPSIDWIAVHRPVSCGNQGSIIDDRVVTVWWVWRETSYCNWSPWSAAASCHAVNWPSVVRLRSATTSAVYRSQNLLDVSNNND